MKTSLAVVLLLATYLARCAEADVLPVVDSGAEDVQDITAEAEECLTELQRRIRAVGGGVIDGITSCISSTGIMLPKYANAQQLVYIIGRAYKDTTNCDLNMNCQVGVLESTINQASDVVEGMLRESQKFDADSQSVARNFDTCMNTTMTSSRTIIQETYKAEQECLQ